VPSAHPLDVAAAQVVLTEVFGAGLAVGGVEGVPAIEGPTDEGEPDTSDMASEAVAIVSDRGRGGAA